METQWRCPRHRLDSIFAPRHVASGGAGGKNGVPAVRKLLSRTITHKSDVGSVALNLTDAAAVCATFDSNFRCAASGKALSRLCGQTLM
jgi:acyl-CoA synthetase (NDP forming)